jgi:molybdate transport system ATP-binding protein/molybdate/tungstate transport system ATP-binding protein
MLAIKGIGKKAGSFALRNISLEIKKGEYYTLLGVSGSGKTLLLKIIAGFLSPDTGTIFLNGDDITHRRMQHRSVGMVFQDGAIFPHMSVAANIAYPLRGKGLSKSQISSQVAKWAEETGIASLLQRMPQNLSGGELRRLALARTLAMNPEVLLLDEPLSSLDVLLQGEMMLLLQKLHKQGQTIIHVTHDYHEAYALADKLAVMHNGEIVQKGLPREVFNRPATAFIAGLTGKRNFFKCSHCKAEDGNYRVITEEGYHILSSTPCAETQPFFIHTGKILINSPSAQGNHFEAVISGIFALPDGAELLLTAGMPLYAKISSEEYDRLQPQIGDQLRICIPFDAISSI